MKIPFEKWHGCLNDFLVFVVDERQSLVVDSLRRNVKKLCSRNAKGIGADGIALVLEGAKSQNTFGFEILNSDGSISTTSGNGIRCAAACLFFERELEALSFSLRNGSKVEVSTLNLAKQRDKYAPCMIRVGIGKVELESELAWRDSVCAAVDKELAINPNVRKLLQSVYCADIGNPHVILDLSDFPDESVFHEFASRLQTTALDGGINVHLVCTEMAGSNKNSIIGKTNDEVLVVKTYERGAGRTLSCGSGASVVAASYLANDQLDRAKWVAVRTEGGDLFVKHANQEDVVDLVGPAEFCFAGQIEI